MDHTYQVGDFVVIKLGDFSGPEEVLSVGPMNLDTRDDNKLALPGNH